MRVISADVDRYSQEVHVAMEATTQAVFEEKEAQEKALNFKAGQNIT